MMRHTPRVSAARGERWRATLAPAVRRCRLGVRFAALAEPFLALAEPFLALAEPFLALEDEERLAVRDERPGPFRAVARGLVLDLDCFLAAIALAHTSMITGTITGFRFVVSMKNRRRAVRMWSRSTIGSVTPCTADSFSVSTIR
jgi:hypothetical protein